jgi:hypothetical protein
MVVRHLGLERMVRSFAPAGQQPVDADRIDDRAGEDVRADLAALLQHDDREIGIDLLQRGSPRTTSSVAGPAPTITTSNSMLSRSRSLNNSGIAWTEYEFELQTRLGEPSVFGDGISFDQRKSDPENRSSDLFKMHDTNFEPYDRLLFTKGSVDPRQTAGFSFFITDFTPRWIFYIRQDPRIPLS